MSVNKDFKNCKTNRAELDDLQNMNLQDSLRFFKKYFQNDILFQKMQMLFWYYF